MCVCVGDLFRSGRFVTMDHLWENMCAYKSLLLALKDAVSSLVSCGLRWPHTLCAVILSVHHADEMRMCTTFIFIFRLRMYVCVYMLVCVSWRLQPAQVQRYFSCYKQVCKCKKYKYLHYCSDLQSRNSSVT